MKRLVLFILLALCGAPSLLLASGSYDLPPLPPPYEYGSFLMQRSVKEKGVKPVIFSHWLHRAVASCRICHGELGFEMIVGETPVTEKENREGRFCGACHSGEVSFNVAVEENCPRCHTGDLASEKKKFAEFNRVKGFPPTEFGDGIDWVKAVNRGRVAPAGYIYTPGSTMVSNKVITFDAKIARVAPAIFPHAAHGDWMDCSMCHPDLFPLEKTEISKMTKPAILKGEFCGLCHMRVAFPLNDCARCHPGMTGTTQRGPRRSYPFPDLEVATRDYETAASSPIAAAPRESRDRIPTFSSAP